jgi:hypothetical protein
MDFPASVAVIDRPHTLGGFNIADEIDRRFRTGDAVRGQTLALSLPILTPAQFDDHVEHWRTVGLLSPWGLPAAAWVGRASPLPVTLWRYASAPTWSLQPGGLWLVTGVALAAAD